MVPPALNMKKSVMFIDLLIRNFESSPAHIALVWNDQEFSNAQILALFHQRLMEIDDHKIPHGAVVSIEGDFSPNAVATLLALIRRSCILVPQNNANDLITEERNVIAQTEYRFCFDASDSLLFIKTPNIASHTLYSAIKESAHPGLVLFSSGSSGNPKAAVHDFIPLLEKYLNPRKPYTTLNFLLFDHWGGLNTLFNTLSTMGTTVVVKSRTPENVCKLIERYKVSLLPATPTFLNMLLISEVYSHYDLRSLKLITYGAEPMPESILKKLCAKFPDVKLQQTYGLIEVGVLSTKSLNNSSLWVKVGGEGYQTRIVDGLLQIKSQSTILGYLNAPSPITSDGWFMTGDSVEIDGDYLKILGRKSELINVGGEKVYPTEVEDTILECDNILDVRVYGEKNALMGNIVCAAVSTINQEDHTLLELRIKQYCAKKLEKLKVPIKVFITNSGMHSDRFKKIRSESTK